MKTIVANYKMHLGVRESVALARGVLRTLRGGEVMPEIVVCPSYTALAEVRKIVARSHVQLGAQNVAAERAGAFTGEISAQQLVDVGCTHVIVGHSERRRMGESDADVNKKILLALDAGLTPILCVGEKAETQVRAALQGVSVSRKGVLCIAYEPEWAIGTGKSPAVTEVVEMHRRILATAVEMHVPAAQVQVLYGGSVDGENAYALLREPEVQGVLVGGASVKIGEFERVVAAAVEVLTAQS